MRAIQIQEFGGPEVLEVVDLPTPEPGPGEVLVKVTRAGLNFADTHTRTNTYLQPASLPLIPGGEVAGIREDTGQRVLALTGSGGYAEYATANEALTFPLPDDIDDGTALAMVVQGTTAWHLYRTSAQIRPGESVVVHAAGGGVGTLAVQLGKPLGAGRVIATASSEDKRALALELGADAAIDAAPDGMAERLIEANGGERVVALVGSGGYAEYAVAPRALTFPIADGVSDELALALVLQGLTAWHLYRTSGRVAPGESVVVHAAAGGVGSLAVQLGKPLGAGRVIATASTQEKRDLALELGADVAVDGAAEGLTERLVEANRGQPVDVVFEMAGGPVFDASLDALAPFGRLVIYGIASGENNTVRSGSLMRHSRAVVGFWFAHCVKRPAMIDDALADLFARVRREELRVVTGPAYPLEQAAQAQADLAGRRTTGKVTLDPTV